MFIHSISLIQGLSLGIEQIDRNDEADLPDAFVFDLLFLRIILQIGVAPAN